MCTNMSICQVVYLFRRSPGAVQARIGQGPIGGMAGRPGAMARRHRRCRAVGPCRPDRTGEAAHAGPARVHLLCGSARPASPAAIYTRTHDPEIEVGGAVRGRSRCRTGMGQRAGRGGCRAAARHRPGAGPRRCARQRRGHGGGAAATAARHRQPRAGAGQPFRRTQPGACAPDPAGPAPGLAAGCADEPRIGDEAGHHLRRAGHAGPRLFLENARLHPGLRAKRRAERQPGHPGQRRPQAGGRAAAGPDSRHSGQGRAPDQGRHPAGQQHFSPAGAQRRRF